MYALFMHACLYVAVWPVRTLKKFPNAFSPSSGQILHFNSCVTVELLKNSNITKIAWFVIIH